MKTVIKSEIEMKDSGVQWIGDIPANWGRSKLKYLGTYINGYAFKPSDWSSRGRQIIRIQDLTGSNSAKPNYYDGTLDEKYRVVNGDILVSWAATLDAFVWKKEDGWLNQHIFKALPNEKIVKDYFWWLLKVAMDNMNNDDKHGIVMQHVTIGLFNNYVVPLAPYTEQQAIADYLDDKCSKIDEIIAEAKASINEYKELKQSVITNITTQGLRDVSLINSGNMDIGMIPDTWSICKTLYGLAMPITDGPHVTPELLDDGIAFISAEAVSCGRGSIDFNHKRGYISEEFYNECCKKYVPQRDDIYMIKSGATTGTVSIVDTDRKFTIWSPLAVFRVNRDRLNPRYLFYFLQSKPYQQQVQLGWTFGTQQNIGMRTLEQLKICLPPLGEQAEIVEYLDNKLPQIDSLIAEKESLIKDLEAYKKSLIYEVVTGKRRVV